MGVLAMLVALLLPMHGVANAFASIQAPAHYHRSQASQWVAPRMQVPKRGTDILAVLVLSAPMLVDKGSPDATIGYHGHALDQLGVVYTEDDPDRTDHGATGKHVASVGEAALPHWTMPSLKMMDGPALPEPGHAYSSHRGKPHLRPPSALADVTA